MTMRTDYKAMQRYLLILLATLTLGACSTAPVKQGDEIIEPVFSPERILDPETVTLSDTISDPFQGFNRTMYRFNYHFDRYIFLPAVRGYQAVLPDFAERGVHNFFNNIRDITTLFNSILQVNGSKSLETTTRVLFNSTIGLLGFIDVASAMDIPRHREDFGQTLGYWGVGNGPFLVLPILGPSNVRDGVGLGVDMYVQTTLRDELDLETWQEWTWTGLNALDLRANTAFRYFETGSPMEYELVRLLYTTMRRMEIER